MHKGLCLRLGANLISSPVGKLEEPLLRKQEASVNVDAMTTRIDLTVDMQGRMSVGKLGLREGHVVAERLPDESGWIIRAANLYAEAEIDILSAGNGAELVEQGLEDLEHGRTNAAFRR